MKSPVKTINASKVNVLLKGMSITLLIKLHLTVALGDVVEFEILPLGTAAWFCTKDKYNLQMFSDVLSSRN